MGGNQPIFWDFFHLSQLGAAVAEWLSSWLAEQEVRGSIPGLATWISEIGYLLLPSRDMAEIPLKRRKSPIQPTQTNQPTCCSLYSIDSNGRCRNLYISIHVFVPKTLRIVYSSYISLHRNHSYITEITLFLINVIHVNRYCIVAFSLPREDAGGLSREYVLRIPSVS